MKHTPGPWIADYWYVGPKELPTMVKVNSNGPVEYEEILANARLIAAAPELLSAFQSLFQIIDAHLPVEDLTREQRMTVGAARAALAKAQGGAA